MFKRCAELVLEFPTTKFKRKSSAHLISSRSDFSTSCALKNKFSLLLKTIYAKAMKKKYETFGLKFLLHVFLILTEKKKSKILFLDLAEPHTPKPNYILK